MKTSNTVTPFKHKLCIHSTGLLDNKFEIHEINDEDGINPIAEICGELKEAEANAAFIVKAVNGHDALVEALQLLKEAQEYIYKLGDKFCRNKNGYLKEKDTMWNAELDIRISAAIYKAEKC
ncbi:MAG TPA: hypothetical protein VIQ23_10070 [Hanamia sp.]